MRRFTRGNARAPGRKAKLLPMRMSRVMLRWGSHWLLTPIACVFLSALAGAQGVTERTKRFDQFSVRPFVELEPGFTAAPRETFTLEMSGIGRRPVEVVAVELNGQKVVGQCMVCAAQQAGDHSER